MSVGIHAYMHAQRALIEARHSLATMLHVHSMGCRCGHAVCILNDTASEIQHHNKAVTTISGNASREISCVHYANKQSHSGWLGQLIFRCDCGAHDRTWADTTGQCMQPPTAAP